MILRIFGIPTETGVGIHSTSLYDALVRLKLVGVKVEWISKYDLPALAAVMAENSEDDINIFLFRVPNYTEFIKGKKYFWYVFESTKPGINPAELLSEFDYLITPSAWGRDCLIRHGAPVDKVIVIPEGVNIWQYHPYKKSVKKREKIRFLMIGKFESRKGYAEAFEAFKQVLSIRSDVELWIKPDWNNGEESFFVQGFKDLADAYENLSVTVLSGILTTAQLLSQYQAADYFLFPSRCEAWGLPLIEAIASGTPTICCDFGGQSEYLRAISGGYISIPYKVAPVDCEKWKEDFANDEADYGEWAKIDPTVLASIMLEACDKDLSIQAAYSSKIIRTLFSWEQSARQLADVVFAG